MKGENVAGRGLGAAFNRLWSSTASANLADGMALFLLPVMAVQSGASAAGVAAVTAALTAAWPIFGLHAGWLVDRLPRTRVFVVVNLVRALTLAGIALLDVFGELQLWALIVGAAVLGVAETLVDTALTSSVPLVVERVDLARANARVEATINGANQLVGPALAGFLALGALASVAGLSAGLYVIAAAALVHRVVRRRLDRRLPSSTEGEHSSRGSAVLAGIRFVWRQPVVRALTLFTAGMNIVWGAVLALLVVYVVGADHLGLTTATYGLMMTAMAIGGLAASAATGWLCARVRIGHLLLLDCVGTVLLSLPVAVDGGAAFVAVGVVVAGAGSSVWRIVVTTVRQELTPPDQLGRVYAASRAISWGVLPVSALLAGLAAEVWGVQAVFGGVTVLGVGLAIGFAVLNEGLGLDAIVKPARLDPADDPGAVVR